MAGWPVWSMKVAGMLLVWGVLTSANAGSCVGAKPEVEGGTHGLAMMQRDAERQKAVIAEETIGTGADSPDIVEVNGLFIKKEVLANMVASQVAAAMPDPPPFADEEVGTLREWKRRCQRVPEGTIMLKMTMGDFVDYFKPTDGNSFCDMLTSYTKHQWSSDGITWVQPDYNSGHLGGSAPNWPRDGRKFLSIWGHQGRGDESNHGWCCSSKRDGPTDWSQIGTMEALQEPPPTGSPPGAVPTTEAPTEPPPAAACYQEGSRIENADYLSGFSGWYDSLDEVQQICNAEVTCKGYWRHHPPFHKYAILGPGSRNWARHVPNDTVMTVWAKQPCESR